MRKPNQIGWNLDQMKLDENFRSGSELLIKLQIWCRLTDTNWCEFLLNSWTNCWIYQIWILLLWNQPWKCLKIQMDLGAKTNSKYGIKVRRWRMAPQSQKIDKPKKWIRHKKLEFLDKNLNVFGSMSRTLGEKNSIPIWKFRTNDIQN